MTSIGARRFELGSDGVRCCDAHKRLPQAGRNLAASHTVEALRHWQSGCQFCDPAPFEMAGDDQANFQTPALQGSGKGAIQ